MFSKKNIIIAMFKSKHMKMILKMLLTFCDFIYLFNIQNYILKKYFAVVGILFILPH